MRFFREFQSVRAGYKGVVRPKVLGHVHNHGAQIETLKKKLHKVNAIAQYTIVAMSQTTILNTHYMIATDDSSIHMICVNIVIQYPFLTRGISDW